MPKKQGGDIGRLKFREVEPGHWECYRENAAKATRPEKAPEPVQAQQAEAPAETHKRQRGRPKAGDS